MTAWRQAIESSIRTEDLARLVSIARLQTEPTSRVERAQVLLAYREDPFFFAVGRALVHHQTVQRCVEWGALPGLFCATSVSPPNKNSVHSTRIPSFTVLQTRSSRLI
jgi:hypothetical protein